MNFNYTFKDLFLKEVAKTKGMVNCHAHLDRAYTTNPEVWDQAMALMEEKWILNREIKKNHTPESIQERLSYCIENFIEQGLIGCRTFVDADSIVGMMVVENAVKVREKYKDRFIFQLMPQPLEGFLNEDATDFDKEKTDLFEKACDICDSVGGLPSRDRKMPGGDKKHADFILSIAKNLGKTIDVHVDQENNPEEKDSEWFLDKIEEHGMQGKVNLIHCISIAAQEEKDRQRIYKKMVDTGTNAVVCPWAQISMKQHRDKMSNLHNSITPVTEMLEAGVNVAIGTDNISDILVPEDNGNLYEEIKLLACAERLYEIDALEQVATVNGYKVMGINP